MEDCSAVELGHGRLAAGLSGSSMVSGLAADLAAEKGMEGLELVK